MHSIKREYPEAPVVAVGVIIRQANRIALIRRAKEPSKGRWTFPGGAIELGESLHEAARREALEETGLHIELEEVAIVFDRVVRDEGGQVRYHYVIIDYLAHPVAGTLRPGSDAAAARWFGLAELEALDMTPLARELARRLLTAANDATGPLLPVGSASPAAPPTSGS